MGIMATGVHHPSVTRAVREVIFLHNRQRIEIGAKGDHRNVACRVAGNFGHNTSAVRSQLIANPCPCELLGDEHGRLILVAAQFGKSVQVSADLENFRFKLGDATLQTLYEGLR